MPPGIDTLVSNRAEAAALTRIEDPRRAAARLAERVSEVVVTLGAAGAIAHTARGTAEAAPPPVAAVDTRGAGDLFVAAYVWAWLRGEPPRQRLELACAAAALSVGRTTAYADVPTPCPAAQRASRAACR